MKKFLSLALTLGMLLSVSVIGIGTVATAAEEVIEETSSEEATE